MPPVRHQAIIWTNDCVLLIGQLGTICSEIWIKIQQFSCKQMNLKMSKWRPFCIASASMWYLTLVLTLVLLHLNNLYTIVYWTFGRCLFYISDFKYNVYIDGLVQDCSNSIAYCCLAQSHRYIIPSFPLPLRAYTRSVLKQQMADKWSTERQASIDKVRETEVTMERDLNTRIDDAMNFQRKYEHLKTFRDANKSVSLIFITKSATRPFHSFGFGDAYMRHWHGL